ncbi:MAG: PspC domain-containing protein [Gammaproteobacteria bacterium]|nr:PspC domain-containing protein [Gammaproteobacteria bacterium]MDH5345243.1 PspC domain-containing protein [Gammaproteobacteria bacterium]
MSGNGRYAEYVPLQGLYRDRENGWVFGVCAGLAERFNFRTGMVRVIAIACLIVFFWPAVLAYIGATLLLRTKPLVYAGRIREYEFWRRSAGSDHWSYP